MRITDMGTAAGYTLLGLEEEVFVTEPILPSLASLYYLARLLWRNPSYFYTHSASNFARGEDLRQAVMSGIEVSTEIHSSVEGLIADLASRRQELSSVSGGLILPIGHLFDLEAPTNTCGLHIHVGPIPACYLERVYSNLAHFLPLLALLTASSPLAGGKYFGQSFRIAKSYAIGPLRNGNMRYRFQDMIISKRLGTIELRIFDPVWDLERIRALLDCIEAILRTDQRFAWDESSYRRHREVAMSAGYGGGRSLPALYSELREIHKVDEGLFRNTASDALYESWKKHGTLRTYIAIDNAYRRGVFDPEIEISEERMHMLTRQNLGGKALRAALGFMFYYAVKLPYIISKGLRER